MSRMTYADGLAAAARHLRESARRMRDLAARKPGAMGNAETLAGAALLEMHADSLAELPQRPEPTGLHYRGG